MPAEPVPITAAVAAATDLYRTLIAAWNARDAAAMGALFSDRGAMIGFDGSQASGNAQVAEHLAPIFASHPTPRYVVKLREVRQVSPDVVLVQAISGLVPEGGSDIVPELNSVQSLLAVRDGGGWFIELFQNTPAALHGQETLRDEMTRELRELL
jgi:uncharacterized protein (TIGR02246 family)